MRGVEGVRLPFPSPPGDPTAPSSLFLTRRGGLYRASLYQFSTPGGDVLLHVCQGEHLPQSTSYHCPSHTQYSLALLLTPPGYSPPLSDSSHSCFLGMVTWGREASVRMVKDAGKVRRLTQPGNIDIFSCKYVKQFSIYHSIELNRKYIALD